MKKKTTTKKPFLSNNEPKSVFNLFLARVHLNVLEYAPLATNFLNVIAPHDTIAKEEPVQTHKKCVYTVSPM